MRERQKEKIKIWTVKAKVNEKQQLQEGHESNCKQSKLRVLKAVSELKC